MELQEFFGFDLDEMEKRWDEAYKKWQKSGYRNDYPNINWNVRARARSNVIRDFKKYKNANVIASYGDKTLKIAIVKGVKTYFVFTFLDIPKDLSIEINYTVQRIENLSEIRKFFEKNEPNIIDEQGWNDFCSFIIEKEILNKL